MYTVHCDQVSFDGSTNVIIKKISKYKWHAVTAGKDNVYCVTYDEHIKMFICECPYYYHHTVNCKHIISVIQHTVKNAEIKIKE